jgi:hypothetical protein
MKKKVDDSPVNFAHWADGEPNAASGDQFVEMDMRGGTDRARSHCRFLPPPIHFIPDSLTYSVALFLKRQYDRTPGTDATKKTSGYDGATMGDGTRTGVGNGNRKYKYYTRPIDGNSHSRLIGMVIVTRLCTCINFGAM